MNSKTTLIVLIVILTSLITFLGGYLVSQKNNSGQTANISNLGRFSANNSQSVSNKSSVPKLNRISTVKVFSPTISESGEKVIYFEKESGKILATDFSGESATTLNGNTNKTAYSAVWAKDGYEAIISESSKGSSKEVYFNIKNGQLSELNKNVSRAVWSKDGQKIAYLYFDYQNGTGNISIANPDGSSFKNVFATRSGNLNLDWPKENIISFYGPGADSDTSDLFMLNIENGQLEKVLDSLKGLQMLWSPDGSHLLYSYQDDSGEKKVKLLDLTQKNELDIDLLASANKCVWTLNSLSLYCGGKKEVSEKENLYQLDLAKKEFGLIFETLATDTINLEHPILSPTENLLLFVNKADEYLYSINITS